MPDFDRMSRIKRRAMDPEVLWLCEDWARMAKERPVLDNPVEALRDARRWRREYMRDYRQGNRRRADG